MCGLVTKAHHEFLYIPTKLRSLEGGNAVVNLKANPVACHATIVRYGCRNLDSWGEPRRFVIDPLTSILQKPPVTVVVTLTVMNVTSHSGRFGLSHLTLT